MDEQRSNSEQCGSSCDGNVRADRQGAGRVGPARLQLTCEQYTEEIPLVVGGDLEHEVLDLLVAHLALCQPCAERTARAAAARDALLAGLAQGAGAWESPRLWPGVAAAVGIGVGSKVGEPKVAAGQTAAKTGARRRGSLLQFCRAAGRVAVPLAAAGLLFVTLRPHLGSQGGPIGGPQESEGNRGLAIDAPAAQGVRGSEATASSSGGGAWFSGEGGAPVAATTSLAAGARSTAGPVAFSAGSSSGTDWLESVPSGLLEPLTPEDQLELERAAGLRVDLDPEVGVLRIRQGRGAVLTSLRYR